MCRQTVCVDCSVLHESAQASTAIEHCFPSLAGSEEAQDQDDTSSSPQQQETGTTADMEAKSSNLGWTLRKQVEALLHAMAYIKMLQTQKGGSVDGTRLPCLTRMRKR
ncbi:hypothetical protein GUITHDRAFT_112995 [Guillardia theta CCMP2712]|uniref:Uncharacterized protein n=1 Tax=Guillardia theta (strain CCMP2712) TaxID=905079 RepID=L1IY14_GUITC|nr:hypothetical protein GUITHDRAFT_112995 [Guillardia theta CCMP2712]EKX40992.1 hypothetical protein GUITHDRAFT_112995 [Guillardia theta CCMP2712]|eukprot:XP_005827972.1 hypothetical protein GUITHDRAFT_112995 [Guillardia theta CCMP2712]